MPPSTSKPCHNCRRRRLRCDRSWPICHKCAVSGQECLGYGKVFVWTQTTDTPGNPKPASATIAKGKASLPIRSDWVVQDEGSNDLKADGSGSEDNAALEGQGELFDSFRGNRVCSLDDDGNQPQATMWGQTLSERQTPGASTGVGRPGGLTDPVFQDLDRNSRYYLSHCKYSSTFYLKLHTSRILSHFLGDCI